MGFLSAGETTASKYPVVNTDFSREVAKESFDAVA